MRARSALVVLLALATSGALSAAGSASAHPVWPATVDVTFLRAGYGDAALYTGPCGEVGLVDSGEGSSEAVHRSSGGTPVLEWVVATQYDEGHIGDLASIGTAPGVSVGAVIDRGGGAGASSTPSYAEYYRWAESTGQHRAVDIGDVFSLCEGDERVTFTVVSAGTDGTAAGGVPVTHEGDRSLCLHVEFRDFDLATCGDISGVQDGGRSDVETAVAPAFGAVEVVKINDHGAGTSSNSRYVDTLMPWVGVLSVDRNFEGDPDKDVIRRWESVGGPGPREYIPEVVQTGPGGEPSSGPDFQSNGDIYITSNGVDNVRLDATFNTAASDFWDYPIHEFDDLPPPAEPRTLDDACPQPRIQEDGFSDVPEQSTHEAAVDCVVHWRVAQGASPTAYDPATPVTRGQMASFIARLIERTGGTLPPSNGDRFDDDDGSVHEDNINRLTEAQIVKGTGGGYTPGGTVTRAQMAAFLARAYDYRAHEHGEEPLLAGKDYFDDDNDHGLEAAINTAAAAGVTGGYGQRDYQPGGSVRRDQMASFLGRVLDLAVENDFTSVP